MKSLVLRVSKYAELETVEYLSDEGHIRAGLAGQAHENAVIVPAVASHSRCGLKTKHCSTAVTNPLQCAPSATELSNLPMQPLVFMSCICFRCLIHLQLGILSTHRL